MRDGISIQVSQYLANLFVYIFLTQLASIPASILNPLTLLCCSSLLPYSHFIFRVVNCLSLRRSRLSLSLGIRITYLPGRQSGIGGRKLCEYKIQDMPFQVLWFSKDFKRRFFDRRPVSQHWTGPVSGDGPVSLDWPGEVIDYWPVSLHSTGELYIRSVRDWSREWLRGWISALFVKIKMPRSACSVGKQNVEAGEKERGSGGKPTFVAKMWKTPAKKNISSSFCFCSSNFGPFVRIDRLILEVTKAFRVIVIFLQR